MADSGIVVSKLFERAYRMAGALKHPGQGISASESQEALEVCNAMIDGWKIERLLIIYYIRSVFNVTAGVKDYSVGPGQAFDIERPEKIHRAGFLLSSGATEGELPMEIILTYEQYAAIVAKNVQSAYPLVLYYQALVYGNIGDIPYGKATFWPVPLSNSQITLYTPGTLDEFLTEDDVVYMPKGFREMLMYNLAVRIHELYPEKPMDAGIIGRADFYKQRVKNQQLTPILIASDEAVMQESPSRKRWYDARTWVPY